MTIAPPRGPSYGKHPQRPPQTRRPGPHWTPGAKEVRSVGKGRWGLFPCQRAERKNGQKAEKITKKWSRKTNGKKT